MNCKKTEVSVARALGVPVREERLKQGAGRASSWRA